METKVSEKIFVSITGIKDTDWKSKLAEIEKYKIREAALFLEHFKPEQRKKIYDALPASCLQRIPLIHAKNDMDRWEFVWLAKKYNPLFTIHENSFLHMHKWHGFYKNLFLELDYGNNVEPYVRVEKIGGFCIDLSHFKAAEERHAAEYYYAIKRKNKKIFKCNHLNGYSYEKKSDIHNVWSLKNFEYLKTLPRFVFGDVIAIETNNSISEQIIFKKHVSKLLA